MTRQPDYYRVLGVAADSEDVVIRAAYRALMLKYHPDTFKGDRATADRKAKEINAAYEVLGDPAQRARYDERRGRAARGPSQAGATNSQSSSPKYGGPDPSEWATRSTVWLDRFRIWLTWENFKALVGVIVIGFVIVAIGRAVFTSDSKPSNDSAPAPQPQNQVENQPTPESQAQPESPHTSQAQVEPQLIPLTPEQIAEVHAEGLNPDRVFRPQDRFTVAGQSDQQLWPQPNNPPSQPNSVNVSSEIPVSEIYLDSPTSPQLWYHAQGGWLRGSLDEMNCSNCINVRPVTRSDRDALSEDAYLLKVTQHPLVQPGGRAIVFQPGAAQMKAACNIVVSPFTVARQHRQQWVGYFIQEGRDSQMLSDAPVLQSGEGIVLDDVILSAGETQWVHATTSDANPYARKGWISSMCIASNVQ